MCTRCVRFTREISQTGELEVMRRGNHAEIDIFPGPAGRQPAGRQRRRPLPGRRPARQGFPAQAARLVPLEARLDLHALLDRVQHQRRGKPRGPLAVQAPPQSPRQRLLDLRRRTVQLQGGQRPQPAGGDVRPQERRSPAGRDRRGREGRRPGLEGDRRARRDRRRGALAVLDRRGSLPAGSLPEGVEPGQRAGPGAGPDARDRPDLPARPDQGPNRRHQLRRPASVHDPRREVPEPAGRRRGPRAFRGEGHRLRRADPARRRRRVSRVCTSPPTPSTPGSTKPRATPCGRRSSSWSSRTRRSRRWPIWPTSSWPARPSPRRRAATSTPTAGCSTPRRPCRRATARCPTSTCWRSCSIARAGRSIRARSWPSWPRRSRPSPSPRGVSCPAYGVVLGQSAPAGRHRRVPPSFTDTWFVAHGAARWR